MGYKEKQIEKRYYTIGEVAEMFGVNSSNIRYWEDEFDIIQPKKNKKGHRMYTKNDINDIRIVYRLVKEKGYTLEGAKEVIRGQRNRLKNNQKVIESLSKIRSFLQEMRDELDNRLV